MNTDFDNYIAHPLANMFPMIEGQALEDLKHDIAAKGILEPIRLYQGMILDGRNRYSAARAVGHTFTLDDFVQWEAKQSSRSYQPTFTVASIVPSKSKRWCAHTSESLPR